MTNKPRLRQPEDPLTIYEIRALAPEALALFDRPDLAALLGSELAGLHWEEDFAFLFFDGPTAPLMADFLSRHPALALREIHNLRYGQWQDGAGGRPFRAGELTIAPAHWPGDLSEPCLYIDPGLAFGFGGHPTTQACLEFLTRLGRRRPREVLDLGTGTGILALASARLGAESCLGVDYSHLAVEAALTNLALNHLEERVRFTRGKAQEYARCPGGLLLANLHLSLQEELLALGAFEERDYVILSGLLPSEGDRLLTDLRALGYALEDQRRGDRWITMLLKRDRL